METHRNNKGRWKTTQTTSIRTMAHKKSTGKYCRQFGASVVTAPGGILKKIHYPIR